MFGIVWLILVAACVRGQKSDGSNHVRSPAQLGNYNNTEHRTIQVGRRARERFTPEEIALLESMEIPMDRPEQFAHGAHYKDAVPLIDSKMKDNLLFYANLASSSYCSVTALTSWTCGQRCAVADGVRLVNFFSNSTTDVAGFVGISDARKEIYVSFRGSQTLVNWMYNLCISMAGVAWIHPCHGLGQAMVHEGFLLDYQSVRSYFVGQVEEQVAKHPDYTIHITGHSLGAALAVLLAMELKEVYKTQVRIRFTTFEAPRIGNAEFADLVNYHFPNVNDKIRVTNGRDVVIHVPPYIMGYQHAGWEIYIPPGSEQSSTAYSCDSTLEDVRCSAGFLAWSIDDHLHYPWGNDFGAPCDN